MENTRFEPVSTGNWMLTYLIMCIPFINLIMLFVWAFGDNTPASKANWAKASLVWMLISVVFYGIAFMIFGIGAMAAHMA